MYRILSLHAKFSKLCGICDITLEQHMLPGALTITIDVQQNKFNFYIFLNLVKNRNVKDNIELSFIILWNQYENMPFYKVKKIVWKI